MYSFDKKLGTSEDRRRIADRRRQALVCPKDRRFRADRRLNNIAVEWIPFDEVHSHPSTREAFCRISRKNKMATPLRAKDTREHGLSRQASREKEPSPVRSWRINIFKRTQRTDVDQRTIADRRTKNIMQPFNRRVRPDRRLNNISVEWITFE